MILFSHFPTIQGFLTGKNYSYCVVGQNDIERANTLLYDTFYPGEPITKYLGLAQVSFNTFFVDSGKTFVFHQGGKHIPDADRMVQDILPKHLSL